MIDSTASQGSLATLTERRLSRAEFQGLGEMPPELVPHVSTTAANPAPKTARRSVYPTNPDLLTPT